MGFIALITWFVTALGGLYMLAVWLIENDVTGQRAASRLPAPVVFTHLTLALSGLLLWIVYLVLDREVLAWAAVFTLVAIALLGVTMFARWIPVYRGPAAWAGPGQVPPRQAVAPPPGVAAVARGASGPTRAEPLTAARAIPAEGNFPVAVVLAHGALAVCTLVLVLLTALGVGGS